MERHAWDVMRGVIRSFTGRYVVEGISYDYDAGSRGESLEVPHEGVEDLIHELCHYVMAPSQEDRDTFNYGIDLRSHRTVVAEERMCGWIEDRLYAKAGIKRPASSVDDWKYQKARWLIPVAMRRWERMITPRFEARLVEILQMPGGGRGYYKGRFEYED